MSVAEVWHNATQRPSEHHHNDRFHHNQLPHLGTNLELEQLTDRTSSHLVPRDGPTSRTRPDTARRPAPLCAYPVLSFGLHRISTSTDNLPLYWLLQAADQLHTPAQRIATRITTFQKPSSSLPSSTAFPRPVQRRTSPTHD